MIDIRKAAPTDAEALYDLYTEHLHVNITIGGVPDAPFDADIWRGKIARFAENPLYHLLVGEVGKRVVSSVTLVVVENLTRNLRPYALIENVVTHADFRGKGYASALMNAATEIAAQAGCYKIMLLTSSKEESTLNFYEKCGFDGSEKTGFIKRVVTA